MNAYMLDDFVGIFSSVILIVAIALAVVCVILYRNRKRMEDEERETAYERSLRDTVLDTVSEIVIFVDADSRIEWINKSGADFLARPRNRLIRASLLRMQSIEEFAMMKDRIAQTVSKDKIFSETVELQRGSKLVPHQVQIRRYARDGREVFLVVAKDIQEQLAEVSYQKEQKEKISELESLGKIGCWELTNESKKVTWSRGLYSILEYEVNAVKPNLDFMYQMILPEDQNSGNRAFVAAFQDQKPVDQMLRLRTHAGEERKIMLRIRHTFDRHNNLLSTTGFMQDVTEVVSLENSLNYERNLSKAILDHSDILVFVTDSEDKIVLVNSCLTELTGKSETELVGQPAKDYFGSVSTEGINRFSRKHYFTGISDLPTSQFGSRSIRWSLSRFTTTDQRELTICIGLDLTQSELSRRRLKYKAENVPETQLPNIEKFEGEVSRYFIKNRYRSDRSMALISILLYGAADVSHSAGREAAVKYVATQAARLKRCLGSGVLLAHDGGDRFYIFLPNRTEDEARQTAEAVLKVLSEKVTIRGRRISPDVRIGITRYPGKTDTLSQFVRSAETAVLEAVESGEHIVVYSGRKTKGQEAEKPDSEEV